MSAVKNHDTASSGEQLEFEESEVWAAIDTVVIYKPAVKTPAKRPLRKPVIKKSVRVDGDNPVGPRSLPLNIPDWSKILGREHRERERTDYSSFDQEDDEEEEEVDRMPPHEYLARTRVASLSVHEGAGRTLKGRDLSRVRNSIWKQTGFEQD